MILQHSPTLDKKLIRISYMQEMCIIGQGKFSTYFIYFPLTNMCSKAHVLVSTTYLRKSQFGPVKFTIIKSYLSAHTCSEELSSNKAELSSVLRTMQYDIRTQREQGETIKTKIDFCTCSRTVPSVYTYTAALCLVFILSRLIIINCYVNIR